MSKHRKKRQLTNRKKRLFLINGFLVLFLFLGIGYAVLGTNLNISGSITVKKQMEQPKILISTDRNGKIIINIENSNLYDDIKYSIDGENWSDSNQFLVNESGEYIVYIKYVVDGSEYIVENNTNVQIQYLVKFKYGLGTMWEEYVDAGNTVTIPKIYDPDNYDPVIGKWAEACLYHEGADVGESGYYGWYKDSMWTEAYTTNLNEDMMITPTKDTDIFFGFDPWYIMSYKDITIETKERLEEMNLEFVSASLLEDEYYVENPQFQPTDNIYLNENGDVVGDDIAFAFIIYYRDKTSGDTFPVRYGFLGCLTKNTRILVEVEEEEYDKKKKKRKKKKVRIWKLIQDVTYEDDIVVWDFDNGCETTAKPLWIMKECLCDNIVQAIFADGTLLEVFNNHRIFNVDANKFTYLVDEKNTPIGTSVYKEDGTITKLVELNHMDKEVEYYNIITDYHMNMFANGILTSLRLNNLYEIKDLKFVKDDRKLATRDEFDSVDDEFFYGLRLAEQSKDINKDDAVKHTNTLLEYVERLKFMMKPKKK